MASLLVFFALFTATRSTGASAAGPIAPAKACKSVSGFDGKSKARDSILCFTNFARAKKGLKRLRVNRKLHHAATRKAGDIMRCNQFSHTACGRQFGYWIDRAGFVGCSIGENIAWGGGKLGTSREIFIAWMNSPGHRAAILSPGYREIGIGVKAGRLGKAKGARVWVQHFGGRC